MAKNDAQTQSSSPPSGPDSAPGLGEAFQINLNTGQGVYSYKLTVPDGVAKHTPKLTLEYSHGARSGPFGFGWRLGLRTIDRRLDRGAGTEAYLDGGAELVELADGSFGAQNETAFTRYARSGDGWTVEERDGVVHTLGTTAQARVADPDHPERVAQWLIERSVDAFGNAIDYRWEIADGYAYPVEVSYAAYAVRLAYEDRPDVRLDGRAGFLRRLTRRCTAVELFLDPGAGERRIRRWALAYDDATAEGMSLLASVQPSSFGPPGDSSRDVTRPPVSFAYEPFDPTDRLVRYFEVDGSAPPALGSTDVALVTLDRAPLPGLLQVVNGRQYYWANDGAGRFEGPRRMAETPYSGSFAGAGVAFVDLDGSGSPDLMTVGSRLSGYYENAGPDGWGAFVGYPRGSRAMPAWSSTRVRLSDADGDGRVDAIETGDRYVALWRNLGADGWSQPVVGPRPADGDAPEAPDVDFADPLTMLADMTGDGLQDVVRVRSGSVEYWPSLGDGRFGPRQRMAASPRIRDLSRDPRQTLLMDVDGDGCADLVRVSPAGVTLYLNHHGASFGDPIVIDTVPPPIPGTLRVANGNGGTGAGLVWNSYRGTKPGYVQLEFAPQVHPYALVHVDNGAGLESELSYRSATEYYLEDRAAGFLWSTNFPFPFPVVASTREVDHVAGQVTEVRYGYHEAHYEPHTRQFQGFRSAERVEVGDASRPDTRTSFHFLMAMERRPGNGREHSALNGLLERSEIYSDDGSPLAGRPLRIESAEHELVALTDTSDGAPRAHVRVTSHRTEDTERGDDVRVEEKTYTYDALGNVVREVHRGSGTSAGVARPELVRTTDVTYASGAAHRVLGKPATVVVRDGAGEIVSETRTYYDGADYTGLPLGQLDRGAVTRESRLAMEEADFAAHYAGMDAAALGYRSEPDADGTAARFADSKRQAHDGRGLVVGERDPLGAEQAYQYDAAGLLRTQLTDSLGVTVFEYDRAVGQPTRITYADGSVSSFEYDAQGRLLATVLPGDDPAQPPRRYSYDDGSVPESRTTHLRPSAGGPGSEIVTYYNGRGAEHQHRVQMNAGTYVVSGRRTYNPWGDLVEEYEPTFSPDRAFAAPAVPGAPARRLRYDGLGRAVGVENFTGGLSTAAYEPFAIVSRDANDNDHSPENVARGHADTPRREEFDVFRQRTSVVEALGGGDSMTTTYVPGPDGLVRQATDDAGELFSCSYDLLGNRLEVNHRAAGRRRLFYDARGKVVRSLDAAGNDVRVELDARGRIVRLLENGTEVETYAYDVAALNAHGKLASVSYPAGSQTFTYDAAGRLLRHDASFATGAAPHTTNFEYDALGRETAVVHGDGTRIAKTLTFNGWVAAIDGVLDEVRYNAAGVPDRIAYANGVTTDTTYVPGPPRVRTQRTTAPGGQLLEDLSYDHDALGLMLSSDDAAPGGRGSETYSLDPLYQLSSVTSTAGGGAPVTSDYEYSNHVNIARLGEHDSVFSYDDPGHPDRIGGVTVGSAPRVAVSYDANGNLLSLPSKTFAYNPKNELSRVEAGGVVADYGYDHHGTRVSKTVQSGGSTVTTNFVGLDVEIRAAVPTYFVRLGDRRVAVLNQGTTRFVHTDQGGSTAFYTDGAGAKLAAIAYRPFGNVASSSGDVATRTFSVHPYDAESGLYYMRRRYYAPEIGRFLTPDPLALLQPQKLLGNPKALYPYVYVGNDPLDNIDYDGLSFWSVVGAIVGVVAAVAVVVLTAGLAAVIGVVAAVIIGAIVSVGLVAVGYAVANANRGTGLGEFFRGFMIGLNAGLNAIIGSIIFGPAVGVALGVINFLAAFDGIAGNRIYQGFLGYASWLMPMSWLVTAVGLIFFVINIIVAGVTFQQWDAAKITDLHINWETGSIVTSGGLIRPAGGAGGFDMGNFVFLQPGATGVEGHETGHTLNLAAYGWAFHYIGAIDENVTGGGADAFSEHLADSHDPARAVSGQWWDMWDPNH